MLGREGKGGEAMGGSHHRSSILCKYEIKIVSI